MTPLRRGQIVWPWTALPGVSVLCAGAGILWASHETLAQVDCPLQQVARIIAGHPYTTADAGHPSRDPPLLPAGDVRHDRDDNLVVTVRDGQGGLAFQTVQIGPDSYRVLIARSQDLGIQVAQPADEILEQERHIATAILLPIGLLLPILAIVLGLAIERQLRPFKAASGAAAVRPLSDEINRLLGRLGKAMERERRFVTDAAHALRTPLTALTVMGPSSCWLRRVSQIRITAATGDGCARTDISHEGCGVPPG